MDTAKRDLTPLADVIADLMTDGSLPFDAEDAHIWKVWDEVIQTVRPDLAGACGPSRIKQKRLQVTVTHPIYLQELRPWEKQIRGTLNRKLKREAVLKIDFRVGSR
ncbi:MAG: DUF721 domain-containing protein [Desulfatiglandaceae bacterium]